MAKAALLGIGVVGSGVAELLRDNASRISADAREEITLKYILASRKHPDSPFADKIIHDFSMIENDDEISVVIECIGGAAAACDYVSRALRAGKSVVTSNKELIAEKGLELLTLAKAKRVSLLFEASVGGGIPIIRPLTQSLSGNRIDEIFGILNGTTNYILTQMLQCGKSFDAALREAQALGYAEADPTADVDGIDAARKICILADLCFGRNVPPEKVSTEGIRGVTALDAGFASGFGYSIKLLGRALRAPGKALVYVAPHLVPADKLLSSVSGVMNGIVVRGNAVGECLFYGAGAGKLPTASAVVADVIDAVRHEDDRKFVDWAPGDADMLLDPSALPSRWYIRAPSPEEAVREAFHCPTRAQSGQCAAVTEKMMLSELRSRAKDLKPEAIFRVMD